MFETQTLMWWYPVKTLQIPAIAGAGFIWMLVFIPVNAFQIPAIAGSLVFVAYVSEPVMPFKYCSVLPYRKEL